MTDREQKYKAEEPDAKPRKHKPIDFEGIKKMREGTTFQKESAGDFIRRMRDEDRY